MFVYTRKHQTPFQIDEDDFELVSWYTWHIGCDGYPSTMVRRGDRQTRLRLHILLLGIAPNGLEWDHKNRDRLDNRRENLRPVTSSVNKRNTGIRVDNTSRVKGVRSHSGGWSVEIRCDGQRIYIGWFKTIDKAITARKQAEDIYWGNNR